MTVANIPDPKDAPPGTLPTFRAIKSAIDELERAQKSNGSAQGATDKGQAATLQSLSLQVADLSELLNNIATQTAYDSKNTQTQFAASFALGVTEPLPFDATYDPSVTIVSPETGKISITVGGFVSVNGTNAPGNGTVAGGGGGIYADLSWSGGSDALGYYEGVVFQNSGAGYPEGIGGAKTMVVNVPANTTITIRARRWWRNNNSTQVINIRYQNLSLVVTKLI